MNSYGETSIQQSRYNSCLLIDNVLIFYNENSISAYIKQRTRFRRPANFIIHDPIFFHDLVLAAELTQKYSQIEPQKPRLTSVVVQPVSYRVP